MCHWLESEGYTVVQAEDGSKAWDSARHDCPPIVVTDWNMPRMSGLELCRSIRSKHESDQVYLLVASSREEGADISEALLAGANDFLSKPIREDELLARIRNAENSLMQLKLRSKLADCDPLTGLLNRRALMDRAEKALTQTLGTHANLSCMVIDVDFFKRYNDDFGHATGDKVLRAVADCIQAEIRENDLACRLGGDEFCIFLPGVPNKEAFEIAERIRQQIACNTCKMESLNFPIKASIGVATWNESMQDVSGLINAADQSLLVAKRDGRNRTSCHQTSIVDKIERKQHQQNPASKLLTTYTVSFICQTPITAMYESESIAMACHVMASNHIDCIFVVNDKSELVGTITERELLSASLGKNNLEAPVKEIMSFNFVTYSEDTPIASYWESYQRNPLMRSVVVDYLKRPQGLIRSKRLLFLVQQKSFLAN